MCLTSDQVLNFKQPHYVEIHSPMDTSYDGWRCKIPWHTMPVAHYEYYSEKPWITTINIIMQDGHWYFDDSSDSVLHVGCYHGIMARKHFLHYCPFVRGIHRWQKWSGDLMFSLLLTWTVKQAVELPVISNTILWRYYNASVVLVAETVHSLGNLFNVVHYLNCTVALVVAGVLCVCAQPMRDDVTL